MTTDSTSESTVSTETLDEILALQFLVAWAGEEGDEPRRLGWWRTAMVDEFGGEDLFKRLLPQTWRWAVLEAARAAAIKIDAHWRGKAADADSHWSLFHLGFALDEALDDRLAELKRTVEQPAEALPGLGRITTDWNPEAFRAWLGDLAPAGYTPTPAGRRMKGKQPDDTLAAIKALAAAHADTAGTDTYPAPYYRRDR